MFILLNFLMILTPSLSHFPRQLEDRTPVEFRPSLSAEHTFLFIQIQENKNKAQLVKSATTLFSKP